MQNIVLNHDEQVLELHANMIAYCIAYWIAYYDAHKEANW